jgi:DNA primase
VGAVLRTLDLFVNTDLTVKVVVLPSGDDPDTFVRTCGIEPFLTLVERADGLIDFALARCLAGRKAGSVTDRVRCADEVLRIIQKTKNPIQKEEYIKLVSENLGVGEQVLMERYPMLIAQPRTHAGKSPEPEPKRIGSLMKGNPEERDLVMLLLQGSLQVDHLRQLKGKVFTVPNYRHIVEMGLRYVGENGALMLTDFRAEAMNDSECAPLVAQLTVVDQHFDDVETYIQGCLTVIERKRLQANLDTLITQLRKAERDGQQNEVDRLNLQIDHLRGQKAALMATSVPVGR